MFMIKYVKSWHVKQCLDTYILIMTRLKRPFRRRRVFLLSYHVKVVITLVFGMIFGLSFSYITRQCFVRMTKVKCKILELKQDEVRPTTTPTRPLGIKYVNLSMELKPAKYFLLIGVMTADRYISTRVKTIHETWAKTADSVKVIFFCGEQGDTRADFDLIRLPGVDDTYPPQKKSFSMLRYIFEHYINEFHWFVRADDDAHIRSGRLSEVLYSFDSSQDLMFGQPGVGKSHEKGKLGLKDEDNFCIGGVAVVMSQSVVRKVAPYLLTCLNETVTLHEDSELGRCIRRHVGVMCPWAKEVQRMFHQNFQKPERAFSGSLSNSPFRNAITVHPVKEPSYMLHLHHHFLTSDFLDRQHRIAVLNYRSLKVKNILQHSRNTTRYFQKSYFHGLLPRNSSLHWEFCNSQFLYGLSEQPFSWISGPILEGVFRLKNGVMSSINMEARMLLKSQEEFKKMHSASIRTHPTLGLQLAISVETLLKPLTSAIVRFPRRAQHYSHFQQNFAPLWKKTLGENFPPKPTVHFIVPLTGRFDTFVRFLNSFEEAFLNHELTVSLLIVYFPDVSSPEKHKNVFEDFRFRHPKVSLTWSEVLGEFSRARALDFGVHHYSKESLLFFADVDLIFETEFYHRCQAGAVLGKRVYFPLMFSQFNPQVAYYNRSARPGKISPKFTTPGRTGVFTRRAGIWRKYSYGPVCVFAKDVIAVGGVNTTVRGWGLEDLNFYEKCLRHNLEVFRTPDLGLVHVYHAQTNCLDPRMNIEQAKMCEDSKRQGIGSEESLVEYMLAKGYV